MNQIYVTIHVRKCFVNIGTHRGLKMKSCSHITSVSRVLFGEDKVAFTWTDCNIGLILTDQLRGLSRMVTLVT